jgi:ABC-2 type transport system permease protein
MSNSVHSGLVRGVRSGLARGVIELRQTINNLPDLWSYLFPNAILVTVMVFMRDSTVPGTALSLGTRTLPSVLGATIAYFGLTRLMLTLTLDRADGTLLRAKAVPNGMIGYLVGRIVLVAGMTLVNLTVLLVAGALLFDGLAVGIGSLLTLAWVLALGLTAILPLGAMFGSLFANPRALGMVTLPVMGLVAVSGIFYPITNLPTWLQWVAQVFPVYWLGLGMRSALLPGDLAAVELHQSWQTLQTLGVLGAWAVAGMVAAPVVLRRAARRASAGGLAARRRKALPRAG